MFYASIFIVAVVNEYKSVFDDPQQTQEFFACVGWIKKKLVAYAHNLSSNFHKYALNININLQSFTLQTALYPELIFSQLTYTAHFKI